MPSNAVLKIACGLILLCRTYTPHADLISMQQTSSPKDSWKIIVNMVSSKWLELIDHTEVNPIIVLPPTCTSNVVHSSYILAASQVYLTWKYC